MLESYNEYTKDLEVPQVYKQMCFLHAVSAVIGRQVWWRTSFGVTYPNIYTMLVGGPGTGKSQAVTSVYNMIAHLAEEQRIFIGATNMTKASMIDQLKRAERNYQLLTADKKEGEKNTYHHLNILSSELGTLNDKYSPDFLSTLSTLYDNERHYIEEKRGDTQQQIKKSKDDKQVEFGNVIRNPMVSFISGTQPKYMTEHIPMTAWEQGFATRLWIEYVAEGMHRKKSLFSYSEKDDELLKEIIRELERLLMVEGEITFSPGAMKFIDKFYLETDRETAPRHSMLGGFNERRALKLQKVAVLIALCRRDDLVVQQEDVELAMAWMLDAEDRLLKMFDVIGTSKDSEVIRAIYEYVRRRHETSGVGTTEADLRVFISNRGDVHKTQKYIDELKAMQAVRTQYATIAGVTDKTKEMYFPVEGFNWVQKGD